MDNDDFGYRYKPYLVQYKVCCKVHPLERGFVSHHVESNVLKSPYVGGQWTLLGTVQTIFLRAGLKRYNTNTARRVY